MDLSVLFPSVYSMVSKWVITTGFRPDCFLHQKLVLDWAKWIRFINNIDLAASIINAQSVRNYFYRSFINEFKNNRFPHLFGIFYPLLCFPAAHFVYRFRDPDYVGPDYFIFGVF